MLRFEHKVVLVTGASRGIGRATAKLLAGRGAFVVANYLRSADAAAALVDEIERDGGHAEAVRGDVRDSDAVTAMVQRVVADQGRLDVLVNNAGVTADGLVPVMDDEEWHTVMNTNAAGAFRLARAAARPMMLARQGRIINVSSVAATRGGRGQANYAASKAAVEGFTRALAIELAPRGILVNAVAPGVIATGMTERIRRDGEAEARQKIALQHFGAAEDVAAAIAFLASDEARYITGAVLPVDGGFRG